MDYNGRSLPNCLKGCLNDLDCQLDQERCIKSVCMGGCSIPDIENAVPIRNGLKQIPLGSELTIRCQPGHLNLQGSQEGNFACQPTSQGPRLCPKFGKCHDPMCVGGCRKDQDCLDPQQICVSGSSQCSSQACCESISCPMTYEVDPRAKFGPLSKSNLLDEATLTCPDGMVFQPQSGPAPIAQPTTITKASCVQRADGGKWITNPKNLRCVEGCNRDEMPCQKPCHECDVSSWQCVPSACSKFIRNGRLLSQGTQLGLKTHALCNQGSYAQSLEGTLKAVIQLKCKCLEQVPTWTWRSEDGEDVPFEGCKTEFCRTDEDCSDEETCSKLHQCQALQCASSIPGLSGDLIPSPDGQVHLVCHRGFAIEDINNGTITTRIPVECVHKTAERKMVWIPKGHPECAYHDNVKCDFGCQSDKDCPPNERCQIFLTDKSIKHCVPQTCSKPYKQTHGGVVDFPLSGLKESDHVEFRCHPGYGIEPSRLSPFVRTSLQIFCLRNAEPGIGIRLGYFLQNGAQVPICSRGVCSKQEDCYPDEMCFQNICSVRACSNISPISNSHLTNPSKRFQISESTNIQCNQGHVIRWHGQCFKELGVTCFLPEHPKVPMWLPNSNPLSNSAQPSCQKGCSIDSDCQPFEWCDQSQCACHPKACPSTIPFGILFDLTGITEGQQGRFLCQALRDPIPVICQSTLNGEARCTKGVQDTC
ncbi:zonadhesin-like isoform X2 [Tigriopus californicus]|uniref:zonadhesin-like isoform X2 n=1 Tax=Tigriopus californicus TaxID=6832 RepID=UPI0027DA85E4|nr:zonadhesin-like isoform X2 [Tigriopus californicus]